MLSISSLIHDGIPLEPGAGCTGPIESWGLLGPGVTTEISAEIDSQGWVGRSLPSEGEDVEIRLNVRPPIAEDREVSGSIFGSASDFFDQLRPPASRRRVVIAPRADGAPASTGGVVYVRMPAFLGTVEGTVQFIDGDGAVVTCTKGSVLLSPSP